MNMDEGKFKVILLVQINKKRFESKLVNIFLVISFNICFGCSKETVLIETVLLSTFCLFWFDA